MGGSVNATLRTYPASPPTETTSYLRGLANFYDLLVQDSLHHLQVSGDLLPLLG